MLIVIADKGVHENWVVDELPKHVWKGVEYKAWFWKGGNTKKEQRALGELLNFPGLKVLTVNYASIIDRKKQRSTKKIQSKVRKFLEKLLTLDSFFVLDESTAIKDPTSSTSRTAWKLGQLCERKRIMTGTPYPKNPLDAFGQYRFLDPHIIGCRTYSEFKSEYAIIHRVDNKYDIIKGYKNVDKLKALVDPHTTRVLKDEVLDLLPKVYMPPIRYELNDEQERVYGELTEKLMAEIYEQEISASLPVTRLIKFQQVVNGFIRDEEGVDHAIGKENPRIEALRQSIKGATNQHIIWAWYQFDLKSVADMLREEGFTFSQYHGAISDNDRSLGVAKFKAGENQFMLASQGSAAKGHTWIGADHTYYYSQNFNGEMRWQSEDRNHRGGQEKSCLYFDFNSGKPIDAKLIASFREKEELAAMMTGDTLKEWV